jgi:hypothetical protein
LPCLLGIWGAVKVCGHSLYSLTPSTLTPSIPLLASAHTLSPRKSKAKANTPQESPLPTNILSTTLLLDALLSLPPRLLLLASLARAPARCGAPGSQAQGIIWTRCADAAIGPIVVVVVVVLGSGLEAWGGWWVGGWGRRLGSEQMRERREREEEGEGGKERFCDEV